MGNEALSAVLAIGSGAVIAIALFVPFVAVSYRRRGRLTFGRTLLWIAAVVYFCAIWTYTLFPLPDPEALRCVGTNTDVWQAVRDIQGARDRGRPFTDPATLQLALNVVLFVPLGAFLRVLGGRGVPTALIVGLGVSLFVETTQLTGMWGIYDCAYRVFDVNDLMTNTAGAVLGSVVALVIPQRMRGLRRLTSADRPGPVTRTRRIIGAACDVLASFAVAVVASIATQLWLQYVLNDRATVLDGTVAALAASLAPAIVWFLVIAVTGQSVGDLCVELEYRGSGIPMPLVRLMRFIGSVGAMWGLAALPGDFAVISNVLAGLALVLLFVTAHGRGLPGLLTGGDVVDARRDPSESDPCVVDNNFQ